MFVLAGRQVLICDFEFRTGHAETHAPLPFDLDPCIGAYLPFRSGL